MLSDLRYGLCSNGSMKNVCGRWTNLCRIYRASRDGSNSERRREISSSKKIVWVRSSSAHSAYNIKYFYSHTHSPRVQECPGTMNDVFKFPVSVTLSCEHTQQCAVAGAPPFGARARSKWRKEWEREQQNQIRILSSKASTRRRRKKAHQQRGETPNDLLKKTTLINILRDCWIYDKRRKKRKRRRRTTQSEIVSSRFSINISFRHKQCMKHKIYEMCQMANTSWA